MKPILFALLLLLAPASPAADAGGVPDGSASPAAPRANVLLVTLDTTRADRLGCYGHEGASTPNLDGLAAEGVRFRHAVAPTPLTLPSHASLMSGRVPRRHGVRHNALFRLDGEVPVLAEILRDRGYDTAAFVSSVVLDRIQGLHRGFRIYDDSVRVGERSAFNYRERAASQTNAAVLAALDDLRPPYFLWVHYFDPHLPYVPPEPFRTRFRERPYDGEIAFMDRELGELLSAVRGGDEPLIVVVAGDHGESLGEHGEDAHGIFVYQATQHVPLMLTGHGIPAGKVVDPRVGLVDLAPTLLDLLGLPAVDGMDGRSLLPLLRDEPFRSGDYELETFFPALAHGWSPLRALLRGDSKYVDAPRDELYDLAADPGETRNLVADLPREAGGLAKALRARTEGDRVLPGEPDPAMEEQRRKLEALGYVTGSEVPYGGDAIDPKDGVAWLRDLDLARRAAQEGRPRDGIAPLERLLEKNPENVQALLALSGCRLGAGDAAGAAKAARGALELRAGDPLAHFHLANALAAVSRIEKEAPGTALRHYRRALELNPRYAEAYLNLASFLVRRGELAEALALLVAAGEAGVRDPDLEIERAVLELRRGRAAPAKAALQRALELNPRSPDALEALGRLAFKEEEYTASANHYRRLLDEFPSAATARTLGSILLYKLDDRAGALAAFRRAIVLSAPDDPELPVLRELVRELEEGE